jgi:hypothetical protein
MKKRTKKQKLKHYVIEVIVEQRFSSLKDIEASSQEEAFEMAKKIAAQDFSRELATEDYWTEIGKPLVIGTTVEDEYPVD